MTQKKPGRFSSVLKRITPEPEPERAGDSEVVDASAAVSPAPPATAAPKMGRPPGKKTDPNYTQVTVYLRKDIHRQAKKILIDDGREFSELVDELVTNWISEKSKV